MPRVSRPTLFSIVVPILALPMTVLQRACDPAPERDIPACDCDSLRRRAETDCGGALIYFYCDEVSCAFSYECGVVAGPELGL